MGIVQQAASMVAWGLKGDQTGVRDAQAKPDWNLSTVNVKQFLTERPLNPWIFVFLVPAQLAALAAPITQWHAFQLRYVPIMVAVYLYLGFSVTFYLHRHLTHKGFETTEWIKFLFAFGACAGLSGDPVGWVGDHRHHHRASDMENDIHSPKQLGFWMAHWGWIFKNMAPFAAQTGELANDVRRAWYNRMYERPAIMILPHLLMAGGMYLWLGLPGLLWCFYFPLLFVNHSTWAVNSVCHVLKLGYRNYETQDDSVNNFVVGLTALGEGFHNNHHANGRRASHGQAWYEPDITKGFIWLLERVGLVWDVVW